MRKLSLHRLDILPVPTDVFLDCGGIIMSELSPMDFFRVEPLVLWWWWWCWWWWYLLGSLGGFDLPLPPPQLLVSIVSPLLPLQRWWLKFKYSSELWMPSLLWLERDLDTAWLWWWCLWCDPALSSVFSLSRQWLLWLLGRWWWFKSFSRLLFK